METTINYNQILKDCFWEYNFKSNDIIDMAGGSDVREQQFLFGKILVNSTRLLTSMEIFRKADFEKLLMAYKVPTFNHHYISRRKNMLEYYFLGKPLLVKELQWVA